MCRYSFVQTCRLYRKSGYSSVKRKTLDVSVTTFKLKRACVYPWDARETIAKLGQKDSKLKGKVLNLAAKFRGKVPVLASKGSAGVFAINIALVVHCLHIQ